MCIRGKSKGNGGTFFGRFEGVKLRGEMGTTTDLAKMRTKGIGYMKGVGNRRVMDCEYWGFHGGMFSRKFVDLTPHRWKGCRCR